MSVNQNLYFGCKMTTKGLTTCLQLSAPNLERGVEGSRRYELPLAVGGEAVDAPLVSLARVHVLHGVRLHVPLVQHDHLKWSKNCDHCSIAEFIIPAKCTGWPFRLCQTSHWHQNKSSVLIWGAYTKTQHLFLCQRAVWHNLNGHYKPSVTSCK